MIRQRKKESKLTPREREIMLLKEQGMTNKEAACQLKISMRTVETYMKQVRMKLDTTSDLQSIAYCIRRKLI